MLPINQIRQLTPQQLERIPEYRQKWREIASNPAGVDPVQVQAAIAVLYPAIGLPSPQVQVFQGPETLYQAFKSHRFRLYSTFSESCQWIIRRITLVAVSLVAVAIGFCWLWATIVIINIFPLKMVCPSTQHIHVLRIPPNIRSAREAAKWINWGIDPNEFSRET